MSIHGAVEILANGSGPVIIYDCCSATEDWSTSIARLTLPPEAPCIVLAVRQVDEELWRQQSIGVLMALSAVTDTINT
jgi:hypothetical protein